MKKKPIICRQCGSVIPPGQARCSYCGSAYEPEAEREYMRKLEQVRADLDQVGEAGAEASHREIKNVSSRVLRILGVILVTAFILTFAVHWNQQRENTKNRQEYLWQQDVFPELDRLYEAEDYDVLLDKVHAYEDEGHSLYQWDHRAFCDLYESTIYADLFLKSREKGFFESQDAVQLLHDELKFRGVDHRKGLPVEDRERLRGLFAPYENDLTEIFRMTEADLQFFDRKLKENNGYPSLQDCEDYVRNHPEICPDRADNKKKQQ